MDVGVRAGGKERDRTKKRKNGRRTLNEGKKNCEFGALVAVIKREFRSRVIPAWL